MVRGQSVNLDLKVVLNEETAEVLDADGKEILDGDEVDDSVLVRSLQEWSRPGLSDVPLPPQVGSICDATGVGELEQAMKREPFSSILTLLSFVQTSPTAGMGRGDLGHIH